MPRHLFIVARDQPDLWAHPAREFSGEPDVQVLLDRRRTDRRRAAWLLRGAPPPRSPGRPPVQPERAAMNVAPVGGLTAEV